MKKVLLAVLCSTLLFTSCKEEAKIDISYEKTLMDKHWVLTDLKNNPNVNVSTNTWTSTFGSVAPCLKDNRWFFKSTSDLSIDEYWTKCTSSAPDVANVFYVIQSENYIKIYTNKSNVDGSILVKGDFKMVDVNTFTIDERKQGTTAAITISNIYTYKKQLQ
ncbi:hypothetical protein DBR32_05645 [Taibaiella sp. KBW10]|uniref:hypothetical protein n=1 Tax=Taibaiella sp. KBW10 TaxID=2153357 RepID=UPI000F590624|nr:hypothetical protein [Taibaiella sp. KBW10]RQO31445.1 hypothetical protein DBR32_05645 [Taibaiella sp. KBW10]